MNEGWIVVNRRILKNFLWTDKPFSRGQAWIDMLLLANYEDRTIFRKNKIVTVNRGSFFTSVRELSERWGWGKNKVADFLNVLEAQKMIQRVTDASGTLVSIENYAVYQKREDADEDTDKDTGTDGTLVNIENYVVCQKQEDAERTQTRTLAGHRRGHSPETYILYNKKTNKQSNNYNNAREEKNLEKRSERKPVKKDRFGEYENVFLTQDEFNNIVERYGTNGKRAIDFLSAYIEEKGYKSKSHYLAIQRWVIDAVKEQEQKRSRVSAEKKDRLSVIDDWGEWK